MLSRQPRPQAKDVVQAHRLLCAPVAPVLYVAQPGSIPTPELNRFATFFVVAVIVPFPASYIPSNRFRSVSVAMEAHVDLCSDRASCRQPLPFATLIHSSHDLRTCHVHMNAGDIDYDGSSRSIHIAVRGGRSARVGLAAVHGSLPDK